MELYLERKPLTPTQPNVMGADLATLPTPHPGSPLFIIFIIPGVTPLPKGERAQASTL